MFTKTSLAVAAATASLLCTAAFGQSSAPVTRAEVKAETRTAEKSGQLVPAGEGPEFHDSMKSSKTRAQRKAETRAARKAGELEPAGDAEIAKEDREILAQKTTVNRADRKAQTRAQEKAGKLTPAGEGPDAPRE